MTNERVGLRYIRRPRFDGTIFLASWGVRAPDFSFCLQLALVKRHAEVAPLLYPKCYPVLLALANAHRRD
jgi:hypothetical protein